MEDVDFVVDKLKDITANLRSMSPLYEDFIKKDVYKRQGSGTGDPDRKCMQNSHGEISEGSPWKICERK